MSSREPFQAARNWSYVQIGSTSICNQNRGLDLTTLQLWAIISSRDFSHLCTQKIVNDEGNSTRGTFGKVRKKSKGEGGSTRHNRLDDLRWMCSSLKESIPRVLGGEVAQHLSARDARHECGSTIWWDNELESRRKKQERVAKRNAFLPEYVCTYVCMYVH